ncbi:beta-ketoacyl synthase N-terminal-like domain-containing protein [Streptomyces genisteinicus]|uniref:3-oxoacyl-ACP synthase n=1 Tax=Streptomyces genisteinicus TaxID=2768068 RepID=A0A7H0HVB9_9ACTN|nr:beta-ketoacyl synthase N-terminal-like domain-containing protein [Streptomyces genisteinicus]QNP64485.1 3-oxoacyl-ACP synthase [Streptomyces genisteinicus]
MTTASHVPAPAGQDLIVSGIGVVTPWSDTPATAVRAARPAVSGGWFDHRERLGRRGYKYLPSATQYFLAATKQAIADTGLPLDGADGADDADRAAGAGAAGGARLAAEERRGAAVGTNSAAAALHDEMDRTVLAEGADALSPATAPYFSINLFGSRLATEHALKGFNLTLTSPRTAGLEALESGARSVRLGRASWLLAGATEEALPGTQAGADLSERGAVALVLEPTERVRAREGRGYGHCRVRSFFLPPRTAAGPRGADRVRERIGAALASMCAGPVPEHRVIAVVDESPVATAVATALGPAASLVRAGAGSLEPLLQVAGALAGLTGPVAVVTAAREGNLAVALLTPPECPRRG